MKDDHPFVVAGAVTCVVAAHVAAIGVVTLPDPTSVVWVVVGLCVLAAPTTYVLGRRLA